MDNFVKVGQVLHWPETNRPDMPRLRIDVPWPMLPPGTVLYAKLPGQTLTDQPKTDESQPSK